MVNHQHSNDLQLLNQQNSDGVDLTDQKNMYPCSSINEEDVTSTKVCAYRDARMGLQIPSQLREMVEFLCKYQGEVRHVLESLAAKNESDAVRNPYEKEVNTCIEHVNEILSSHMFTSEDELNSDLIYNDASISRQIPPY